MAVVLTPLSGCVHVVDFKSQMSQASSLWIGEPLRRMRDREQLDDIFTIQRQIQHVRHALRGTPQPEARGRLFRYKTALTLGSQTR